ncbi:hypothetical protein AB2B38_003900 [Balneola sp. MJW-20]|uniref:hypothetical protein n=1 Tax=Gracilimonas aurantiaca TaxID=3234185 RepID=UPI0034671493
MAAISVGIGLGLIVLGVLAIVFAGVRSLMQGKQDYRKIGMMAIPFVVFGVSYAVLGEFAKAGVLTAGVLMALMIGSIAFTGLRGTFKF